MDTEVPLPMDQYAYTLNLGYHSPTADLGAALHLTADDTVAALRLVAQTLEASVQRANELAAFLARGGVRIDGQIVFSDEPLVSPLFTPLPGYLPLSKIATVTSFVVEHAAGLIESSTSLPTIAPIHAAVLADAFAELENRDHRVGFVAMNARDYADLRKFGRDLLNIESQSALLKTGIMGRLWGAHILVNRAIPSGSVFILAEGVENGTLAADGCVILSVIR